MSAAMVVGIFDAILLGVLVWLVLYWALDFGEHRWYRRYRGGVWRRRKAPYGPNEGHWTAGWVYLQDRCAFVHPRDVPTGSCSGPAYEWEDYTPEVHVPSQGPYR